MNDLAWYAAVIALGCFLLPLLEDIARRMR